MTAATARLDAETWGDMLGRRRTRLGLTQAAMARHLQVPLGTYEGWETGRSTPHHMRQTHTLNLIHEAEMRLLEDLLIDFNHIQPRTRRWNG